jgi:uncharacterized protein YukE
MTDAFQVETEQLRRLAAVYDQQADRLAGRIPTFSATARARPGAFGDLGPAHDAHASYLKSVDATVSALEDAVKELRSRATDLRAAARLYEQADEASRP